MAQKVTVLLEDDLDGSKAEGTVAFAYNGTYYEIDLSKKNTAGFEKALQPYIGAARRVKPPARGASKGRSSSGDAAAIRAWAKDNGIEVSERGRIEQSVRDAYYAR